MTRRRRVVERVLVASAMLLLALPAACGGQERGPAAVRRATAALHAGEYATAIDAFRALADSPAVPGARRGLLRALAMTGRYDEAERLGRAYAAAGRDAETAATLGEVLVARGRLTAAESAFARGGPDDLRARLGLALVKWRRGGAARDAAARELDAIVDVYGQRGGRLTAEELTIVGTACRWLGEREPQLFKDALKAYDAAIAADSTDPEPRVLLAELFLLKYQGSDAAETVRGARRAAPKNPAALVAAARLAHFEGVDSALALAGAALAVNPNDVDARVLRATLRLDSEDAAEAAAEADSALAVDPTSAEALGVLAAARLIRGDERGFADAERRAGSGPAAAVLYATVAEAAAQHRMYERAVALARRAVAADPGHWPGQVALGLNLMRVGQTEEARRTLETAFRGDPYNVWVKNTLDLLDTYAQYDEVRTRRFRLMLDRKESALLAPYLGELLEEAYDTLAARYGYEPPPVRLEVFRSHADFSVRSVGLAGLGALGVSFGSVLAMDSPGARKVGEFNWGSTAWHELTHAFTLGMTAHRVPRWFSEGLSVLEERRARAGWGAGVSLPFLAALKAGALPPMSRLNDGFVRPRRPADVLLAYYEASLACEMIERDFGAAALVAMLRGYRDGLATDEVIGRVLKLSPAELDQRFDEYLRKRFAGALAAMRASAARRPPTLPASGDPASDDLVALIARGRALAESGNAAAVPLLERATAIAPELGGGESPRWPLARAYEARGDLRAAAAQLDTLSRLGEPPYEALLALARIRETLGDRVRAAGALEAAIWFSPYDVALHQRLAALHEANGANAKAVREWRAVVALQPVDRVEALYRLALAQERAGDVAEARRSVLRALEQAPNYERAQELLLRLQGGKP